MDSLLVIIIVRPLKRAVFFFILTIMACYLVEKRQRKSLAENFISFLTNKGAYTDADSIEKRKELLLKEGPKYIDNLILYFTLVLITVLGLLAFLITTLSAPGFSGWFIALYVIAGAAMNNLYNIYPFPCSPSGKSTSSKKGPKLSGFLIYYVLPVLAYILLLYCGIGFLLPEYPFIFILGYAAFALLFYHLFQWPKLMAVHGFEKNASRICQPERMLMMTSILLVFGLTLPFTMQDIGIDTSNLAAAGEQLLVLSAGHYFWVITDFKELKKDLNHLWENFPLKIFLIVLIVLYFLIFVPNRIGIVISEFDIIGITMGIAVGLAEYVHYSIHQLDGKVDTAVTSKRTEEETHMEIQQTGIKKFIKNHEGVLPLCKFVVEVVIAVAGVFVACSANQISEAQKEIEEKEALPIIDLESTYDDNGNVCAASIINTGGSLSDLTVEIFPFALLYDEQKVLVLPLYKMYTAPGLESPKGTKENCFPLQFLQYKPHTNNGVLLKISEDSFEIAHLFDLLNNLKYNRLKTAIQIHFDYFLSLHYKDQINSEQITEEYYIHTGHNWGSLLNDLPFLPVGISRVKQDTWEETALNKLKDERSSETEAKEYVIKNIIHADGTYDEEHLIDVLNTWMTNERFKIEDFPQEYIYWRQEEIGTD